MQFSLVTDSEPQLPLTCISGACNADYEGAQTKQDAASVARAEGDHASAVALLTEAMALAGPSTSLLATRADCLLHLRRPGAALNDCNEALKLNPDSAKALRSAVPLSLSRPLTSPRQYDVM